MNSRDMAKRVLERVDSRYQRRHALLPVGPLLLVGRGHYCGPSRRFPDGTEVHSGDAIGELHLNNARISQLNASNATRAGLGFARLMFASLRRLAIAADGHPLLADLTVYHGVTWIRPHGGDLGFAAEPLSPGFTRRWKSAWFHLLLWAYASHPGRHPVTLDPHHHWLTRGLLQAKFSPPTDDKPTSVQSARLHRASADFSQPTLP